MTEEDGEKATRRESLRMSEDGGVGWRGCDWPGNDSVPCGVWKSLISIFCFREARQFLVFSCSLPCRWCSGHNARVLSLSFVTRFLLLSITALILLNVRGWVNNTLQGLGQNQRLLVPFHPLPSKSLDTKTCIFQMFLLWFSSSFCFYPASSSVRSSSPHCEKKQGVKT